MNHLQSAFAAAAPAIIKNLQLRNMDGFFYENCESMVQDIISKIPSGSSVTWGGGESLTESGLMQAIRQGDFQLLDRSIAKTPEQQRAFYGRAVLADIFLMSSNAITYQGELINIDGNGNRIACLAQGPKQVFIIVGMNKFVSTVEDGIHRIETVAAPANTQRLNRNTPCHSTGLCGHCFSAESICSHTIITRRSSHPGRIKVFMVAENLGY